MGYVRGSVDRGQRAGSLAPKRSAWGVVIVSLVMAVGVVGWASTASAQTSGQASIDLDTATQRSLRDVVDSTIQWHRSFVQKDAEGVDRELGSILSLTHSLGMERLPDVAASTLVRADEAAGEGDFARAAWGLEAAERLDPGRPELNFARASVEWQQGAMPKAVLSAATGYGRLLSFPLERGLWLHNVGLWCLYTLVLAGGLWLLVQIGIKGGRLAHGLAEQLGESWSAPVAFGVLLLVTTIPLALPYGLLWFFVLWSVLLWGAFDGGERSVLAFVWLLVGLAPLLLHLQQERVEVVLSPQLRAVDALDQQRLYGRLFADLGTLQAVLPESRQVSYLAADLHRTLGQWEIARNRYGEILEEEPGNLAALNNLGVYFFYQEDFGRASEYFRVATEAHPDSALSFYNLNRSYSSRYLLADAQKALEAAQRLDPTSVNQWLSQVDGVSVLEVPAAGPSRAIVQSELLANRGPREDEEAPTHIVWLRRCLGLLFGLGVLVAGMVVSGIRRGGARLGPSTGEAEGGADLLLRVLIPGLPAARDGRPWLAYLAAWPLCGLLLLPFAGSWGYRIPWGFAPGRAPLGVLITLGLVLLLLLRLLQQQRADA